MDWIEEEKRKLEERHQREERIMGWAKKLTESRIIQKIERVIREVNPQVTYEFVLTKTGSVTGKHGEVLDQWLHIDSTHMGNRFEIVASDDAVHLIYYFYGEGENYTQKHQIIELNEVTDETIKEWLGRLIKGR